MLPEGEGLRIAEKLDVPPLELAMLVEEMIVAAGATDPSTAR